MASAGKYAVGIGTGAASGAAAGSTLGPWGAVIGGAIGAGAGAIGTAVSGGEEDKAREQMDEEQKRRRKEMVIQLLRNSAAKSGVDTTYLDAKLASKGMDLQDAREVQAFQEATAINPNAFVPMAQAGAQAAGRVYNALNAPAQQPQLQLSPMQQQQAAGAPMAQANNYQLQLPQLLREQY